MCAAISIRVCLLTAVLAVSGTTQAADAGWVNLKNDTERVIIVQWAVDANGQVRRCRPIRILPGECVRKLHSPPSLTVELFDAQNPGLAVHSSRICIGTENLELTIATDGRGVTVRQAPLR